jgi:predicted P-loop ATPase
MAKASSLPSVPPAAGTNENRKQHLFDWAAELLKQVGAEQAIKQARSLEELRGVTLDVGSTEISLAIRDALHPVSGEREACFQGLNADALKRILRNRFNDLRRDREKVLRRGGSQWHWSDDLILNKDDTVKPNLANLVLILRHNPKWSGVLGYDEFAATVVIRKSPPWGKESVDAPWTDHHEAQTRVWFQREVRINPTLGDVGRAVQTTARHNSFHPVRDYLAALTWDGTKRIDTWLVTYFHAEDTDYIRAVGPRWLISAIARIHAPGCQVDHSLVLEGPQGKRKSQALRTLAVRDAWFTDRLSHFATKDAAIDVTGVWIVEISEMDAVARASSSTAKRFISGQIDRFRPPYGKYMAQRLRQCVFAGSINPPVGGYLKDPTGARRFWPVACRGMINRADLERDRDQLWAEALHRYNAGAAWWLETPELEELATTEQRARFAADVWEEKIASWLGDRADVGIWEVMEDALDLSHDLMTQSVQNRVARILTHLGFVHYRPNKDGKREHRYRRDPVPESSDAAPQTPRTTKGKKQ